MQGNGMKKAFSFNSSAVFLEEGHVQDAEQNAKKSELTMFFCVVVPHIYFFSFFHYLNLTNGQT